MGARRFDCFFEQHIGFGIRWRLNCGFPFTLSIAILCVTITIGFGRNLDRDPACATDRGFENTYTGD